MQLLNLVAQGEPNGSTLAGAIKAALTGKNLDRLDVAVAYATRSGLTALRNAADGFPEASRWVVGLDDAITQPEAIDDLLILPNAAVRLASLSAQGRRFHPKMYCFWSNSNAGACICIIGSANMTLHGLSRNGETAVILVAENVDDANTLKWGWNSMWALGEDATVEKVEAYREFHARARKAQRRLEKIGAVPIQPEAEEPVSFFDGNPATATVAWTEGATPSAGGRDLEFPRKLMPFFNLGGSPSTKMMRMANGHIFPLTFTMRDDNQMWRLMFSRDSILAAVGRESLRPVDGSSNRSDLAIVFSRTTAPADYDIRMVQIGSDEHQKLIDQANEVNGLDRTHDPGGRYFGFS
jgi:HKD family nuclease